MKRDALAKRGFGWRTAQWTIGDLMPSNLQIEMLDDRVRELSDKLDKLLSVKVDVYMVMTSGGKTTVLSRKTTVPASFVYKGAVWSWSDDPTESTVEEVVHMVGAELKPVMVRVGGEVLDDPVEFIDAIETYVGWGWKVDENRQPRPACRIVE